MRSTILLFVFLGMLPVAWVIPYAGVVLWCWVAFMSPHQLVWGLSQSLRLNLLIAVVTILGWFFSREPKRFHFSGTAVLVLSIAILTTISSALALNPDAAWTLWERHIKTFMLIFMILAIMNNKVRIHTLIWIIVLSIGYYSVKGGIFAIVTGGSGRILGPEKMDNNYVAMAMTISLPLMNYLRIQSERKLVQYGLMGAMALTVVAVLGTYSRGGFISIAAVCAFLWLKSSNKLITLLFVVLVLIPAVHFMPQQWVDRMNTIETASENDGSFQGRLRAWETSFDLAVDRPLVGGGFSAIETPFVYQKYKPAGDETTYRAAHSIYFQVMGDLGFMGLFLYLLLIAIAWRNGQIVLELSKGVPQLEWARNLASMIQVSFVGFLVGGAALSAAYYDVMFTLFAVIEHTKMLVTKHINAKKAVAVDGTPLQSFRMNS